MSAAAINGKPTNASQWLCSMPFMKSRLLRHVLAALLFSCAGLSSYAGAPPQRATSIPVVVSVAADSITVRNGIFAGLKVTDSATNEAKSQIANVKTFKVDKRTEITLNGMRATLSEIRAGMQAQVTQGMDPTVAARISAKGDRPGLQRIEQ